LKNNSQIIKNNHVKNIENKDLLQKKFRTTDYRNNQNNSLKYSIKTIQFQDKNKTVFQNGRLTAKLEKYELNSTKINKSHKHLKLKRQSQSLNATKEGNKEQIYLPLNSFCQS